jgi:hypothetical protein
MLKHTHSQSSNIRGVPISKIRNHVLKKFKYVFDDFLNDLIRENLVSLRSSRLYRKFDL